MLPGQFSGRDEGHQPERDREQLVLRGDAELVLGALAVGQGGMQADAELGRDRFRAEAGEDAQAHLLLAPGQHGERRSRFDHRLEPVHRIAVRHGVALKMPRHGGAHGRCDRGQACDLVAGEAALRGDAIEIDMKQVSPVQIAEANLSTMSESSKKILR